MSSLPLWGVICGLVIAAPWLLAGLFTIVAGLGTAIGIGAVGISALFRSRRQNKVVNLRRWF